MKSKKLNEAFEYVEDAYLDLTEQEKQRRRPRWIRIAALAACLCLAVVLGTGLWNSRPVDASVIGVLRRRAELLPGGGDAQLFVFSKSGFE